MKTSHSPHALFTSIASVLPVLTLLAALPSAHSAVIKANNADALNLPTSYVGGVLPTNTDVIIFDATITAARAPALGADLAVLGLQVTTPTAGANITIGATAGQTLTIGASGVDLTTATVNLTNAALTALNATQTWNVQTGRTYTQNGALDLGGNALTITGAGAKNFGSLVSLNGGTLTASAGTSTFSSTVDLGANVLSVTGTAAANFGSLGLGTIPSINGTTGAGLVFTTSGVINMYSSPSFPGAISQSAGTLNLNSAGFYDGGFNLSGGTLSLQNGGALGVGPLTITGGNLQANFAAATTLTTDNPQFWNGNFGFLLSNNLNLGAGAVTLGGSRTITIGSAGRYTVGGAIGDGGNNFSLTNAGTGGGILNLTGLNTYGGGTIWNAGASLGISSSAAIGTGPLTIVGGAIGNFSAGAVTLSTNNVQAWNGNFTFGGGRDLNLGTGDVTMNAARTVTITSTASIGGAMIAGSALAPVLTIGGNIGESAPGLSLTAGVANVSATGILNIAGTNNTYTGGTSVQGAVLRFASSAAIPATGTIKILGGGALSVSGAFPTLSSVLSDPRVSTVPAELAGALALTTNSAEDFAPTIGTLSLGAQIGTAVTYTGTITPLANVYRVGGGGGQIIFPNTNAFTGARQVTIGQGGSGMAVISGTNNYTGQTNIDGGVEVARLGSVGGGDTPLGAAADAAGATLNFSSGPSLTVLRYTGAGESTNRSVRMGAGYSGGQIRLDASGSGALAFTDPVLPFAAGTGATAGNRGLTLLGTNTGANTFATSVADNNGTGTLHLLGLVKSQRGNWTLTGANTFTNGITVNGGTLALDYSTNASVVAPANNLILGGGTLALVGRNTGTTAQTLGTLTTTANTGVSNIRVSNNGGAGTALTMSSTAFTRGANSFVNFDLTQGGTVTTTQTLTNGLIGTTGAFTVTTATGADYLTIAGGNIAKLGATTALPTNGATATVNYVLSNPTLAMNGFLNVNSIRVDATANAITWTRGSNNNVQFGGSGGFLVTGGNTVTLTSQIYGRLSVSDSANLVIHQYGTSPNGLRIQNTTLTAGVGGITKTGPGLMDVQSDQIYVGDTNIFGGVWRSSATRGYGSGLVSLATGGILELAAGNFTGSLGRNGAGSVRWLSGDGGFSAAGFDQTVNLGGVSEQVIWGFNDFVPSGHALLLSSNFANATIDFQNPIALGSISRVVEVANGAATLDARLSGVLTGLGTGGFIKSGAGALELSAANAYTGPTTVTGGALVLQNANALPGGIGVAGGTSALILSGGVLGLGNGDFTRALGTGVDQVQIIGSGGFAAFGTNRTVNLGGTGATLVWDSTANFVTAGNSLLLGAAGADGVVNFQNPIDFNGADRTVQVADGTTPIDATLSGVLSSTGGGGLTKTGNGTLELINANIYTGPTTISAGVLSVPALGNGGGSSNLGASSSAASNLVLNGGTLQFTGSAGETTNRLFDLRASSALDASGSVPVNFANPGSNTASGAPSPRTLTLTGGNPDNNILASQVVNSGTGANLTSLAKTGPGKWVLAATNSYSGVTSIFEGTLSFSASANLGDGSATNTIALDGGILLSTGANVNLGATRTVAIGPNGGAIEVALAQTLTVPGAITGSTLNKGGEGTLTLTGPQSYGTLNTNGGVTNVNQTFAGTTTIVNANAATNFATNQRLAALNIGDNAIVTLTASAPGLEPEFGEPAFASPVQAVPEPGITLTLLTGLGVLLGRRRRFTFPKQ